MKGQLAQLLVLTVLASDGLAATTTPVTKVIQMLTEMHVKGKGMMEAEQKTYATYKEWVDDRSTALGFEIKTGKREIDELLAFIGVADNHVAQLARAVGKLDDGIAGLEADKKEATDIRTSEHAEYLKHSQDYSESVDALQRAIQELQSQNYDRPQAEALLQQMAVSIPTMRRVLAALSQTSASAQAVQPSGAPAVAAYEFQSEGIIAILEKLLDKFKGELADTKEQESNQAHAYNLQRIHLTNTIEAMEGDRSAKSALKGKRSSESATAKGQLADTRAELGEDEKFLMDVKATFAAKTETFLANQAVRKDEVAALKKAIEIMSSPAAARSYAEHISFAQGTSLLQVRSAGMRVMARDRAAQFLQQRAQALSSKTLASLAAEVAANPFAKVIEMIKALLARLKEEASAEAEHKAWCDEQLHNNKLKREKKTSRVNMLTADIVETTENIESMAGKIKTLAEEQAALAKAMAEATAQRQKEKAENEDTIKDAEGGSEATKQALVILREFYSSQAELLQESKQIPEMKEYKGMQDAKGGVIGMLEVIQSDFARLSAETKAAETQAAREHAEFMAESKASADSKHRLQFKTELAKDKAEFERGELKKDEAATREELNRATEYRAYLEPICVTIHVSYEERVARRKQELEALREAYGILDSKTVV